MRGLYIIQHLQIPGIFLKICIFKMWSINLRPFDLWMHLSGYPQMLGMYGVISHPDF